MSTRAATALIDRRRAVRYARHRRRRTLLLGAIAALAASLGGWWLATGPAFEVRHVSVRGYAQPDQAKVVQAIQVAALQGDALRLPTQAIRDALASSPWVADVAVHHNWPRGVDVVIAQSVPVAIALTPSGERLVVSDRGRVLGPQLQPMALPELRIPAVRNGDWLRGAARRAPLNLAGAMSSDVGARVRDLGVVGGVLVGRLVDGPQLRFGPPSDLWRKGRALDAILASPKAQADLGKAEYIDLTVPDRPILGGVSETPDEASTASQASGSEASDTQP